MIQFHNDLLETIVDLMSRYTYASCAPLPKRWGKGNTPWPCEGPRGGICVMYRARSWCTVSLLQNGFSVHHYILSNVRYYFPLLPKLQSGNWSALKHIIINQLLDRVCCNESTALQEFCGQDADHWWAGADLDPGQQDNNSDHLRVWPAPHEERPVWQVHTAVPEGEQWVKSSWRHNIHTVPRTQRISYSYF